MIESVIDVSMTSSAICCHADLAQTLCSYGHNLELLAPEQRRLLDLKVTTSDSQFFLPRAKRGRPRGRARCAVQIADPWKPIIIPCRKYTAYRLPINVLNLRNILP